MRLWALTLTSVLWLVAPALAQNTLFLGLNGQTTGPPPACSTTNYNIPFTVVENPITQNNCWQGGHAAGSSCGGGFCWGNMQVGTGSAGTTKMAYGVDQPTQFGDPTAILTGSWSNNQTVTGTVHIASSQTSSSCCHELELRLRMTIGAASQSGYEMYCSTLTGNPYCHIARWNGPAGQYCNLTSNGSIFLKNNDVVSATVSGTSPTRLSMSVNGTPIVWDSGQNFVNDTGQSTSDCPGGAHAALTSGNPGMGQYDSLNFTFTSFGWSTFQATSP